MIILFFFRFLVDGDWPEMSLVVLVEFRKNSLIFLEWERFGELRLTERPGAFDPRDALCGKGKQCRRLMLVVRAMRIGAHHYEGDRGYRRTC